VGRAVPCLAALVGLLLGVSAGLVSVPAAAAGQVEVHEFPDAAIEARYRALIDEFRCPKCLNTNLSGSDAPIAQDLRRTVHRLVVEQGYSDQQVRDFLQERYGDFVLYDPPFKPGTWALWLAPLVFAVLGGWALWRVLGGARRAESLSGEEQARLANLLDEIER